MIDKKPPKQLLTPREFAEWIGLSVPTVYRLKKMGELPVVQISKQIYFIDAEKFMEQRISAVQG